MTTPGEVMQAIGEAYQRVFLAALEADIPYFENKFDVRTAPEKTSFASRSGGEFSFDFNGVYNHPWVHSEVFGECKGYSVGGGLLNEFRAFVAKAYVTSTDYARHRTDRFWFVTNVPFGCSEGSSILGYDFVSATLSDRNNPAVKQILGDGHIDERLVGSLAGRLAVFILTDCFLMNTKLSYKVQPGESLWTILKKIHAGRAPSTFGNIARQIASENNLRSPDRLRSGKRIRLSWYGIKQPGLPS